MTVRAVVLALVLVASCASVGDGDRRTECAKLRDHAAELAVDRSRSNLDAEERAKHERALVDSAGEEFLRRCVEEWSRAEVECGLAAWTTEQLKRCRGRR